MSFAKRNFGFCLAIVDNGFVYVGDVQHDGEGYYVITDCKNVRKAGTTKGFGQIAYGGPTGETELDPSPHVLVPEGRMCHIMECVADKWGRK
jgi:hypothetical protein